MRHHVCRRDIHASTLSDWFTGVVYHVLNRAAKRVTLFDSSGDYAAFERTLFQAKARVPLKLFTYCVMPNHWHLVIRSETDGDLSRFMHWLTVTHAQRWHAFHGTAGTGSVYQGRFKSIPVESNAHFLTVCRYVERNPRRANLVTDATQWRWSALWRRCNSCDCDRLDEWPVDRPTAWIELVNTPQTERELESIRQAITRNAPHGNREWQQLVASGLGLESTLRPIGRPKKDSRPLFTGT